MNISRNAIFNIMLARQNDTMSKHTNDILLSSMGGALSLIGSKNLYNALDEEIKEKDEEISKIKNTLDEQIKEKDEEISKIKDELHSLQSNTADEEPDNDSNEACINEVLKAIDDRPKNLTKPDDLKSFLDQLKTQLKECLPPAVVE